jgi:hypothetical protein
VADTTGVNTTSVVDKPLIARATPSVQTVALTCPARSEVDRGAEMSERKVGRELAACPRGVRQCSLLASPVTRPANREPVRPISEGRYKIRFTAGQRVRDLLQEAQDLYRNQLPNGDIEVLFERALVLLVSERKKQLLRADR